VAAADLNNVVLLIGAELSSDVPVGGFSPIAIRITLPALVGAYANTKYFTRLESPGPGLYSIFDELYGQCSVLTGDQSSSSSPQIASAFFFKARSAAVSARALSLR